MAVNETGNASSLAQPMEQFRPKSAVLAALVSGGIALAAAVGLIVFTISLQKPGQQFPLWLIPAALGLAAVALSSLQIIKLNAWAQQSLLAFWLLIAVAALTAEVDAVTSGAPAGWPALTIFPYAAAVGVVLAASLAAAGLGAASQPNSRLRYSTIVILSLAAAVAVLLVVNLIAQSKGNFYRKDVQWLGQYGLSDRSKKILGGVQEKVKITSLYATSESNANSGERAARVWDLLAEVRDLNPKIEIARAASDADRAEILARLAQQARSRAPAHEKFLNDFNSQAIRLGQQLGDEEERWGQLAGDSYLNQWGAAAQIEDIFKGLVQDEDDLARRLPKEMAGLPDYPKLADDVKSFCAHGKEGLSTIDDNLKVLAKLPAAVAANRAATLARVGAVSAAVRQAAKALTSAAASQATQPADPGERLKAFMVLAQSAGDKASSAATALDEVAGPENAKYVRGSSAWLLGGEGGLTIDATGALQRNNLSYAFRAASDMLLRLKTIAQGSVQAGTKEYQAKILADLAKSLEGPDGSIEGIDALIDQAKKALVSLSTVDAPTADVFKQVAEGKYLQATIGQLSALVEEANKLPALPPSTLAADVTEENTVLIETADKTEVVRFDQVWPLRARPQGPGSAEAAEQRVFNGDSAISSKVLTMTQKPCATVILAYMQVPPQMAQMGAEPGMTPQMLEEMQGRLRQANFRVKTWDLSGSDAPPDADDANEPALPKVLIVLPPTDLPPMMARGDESGAFGPRTVAKLRRLIDSGEASGAIFLATFQPPMSPYAPPASYGWNEYLRPDWGVQARTSYLLVPAVSVDNGQKFQLSATRLQYLRLTNFSDHPIVKPLQGQRIFCAFPFFPAPVVESNVLPAGVSVQALVTVPSEGKTPWASSNFQRLVEQFQETGSYVSPDYEGGDMKAPFDVAVAAKREGDPNRGVSPARVVVLGIGGSMVDAFVTRNIYTVGEKNQILSEDPPRGNLDVVVNSAYWVCARDEYIAAGPVQVQPIRKIGDNTYKVLWMLCVVGLPALLLCVGGVVLLVRRR